jgi:chromosome partitioning protein
MWGGRCPTAGGMRANSPVAGSRGPATCQNRGMTRVIAVANQKGGVAKTTTVHTLGAALHELGDTVLMVDLDPQASLSYAAGVEDDPEPSMHDVMMGRAAIADILYESAGLDLAPSSIDLAGAEVHLLTKTGREYVLQRAIRPIADGYDFILIDCPPSLGILTINALTAAQEVLIPLQAELLTRRGLAQLLDTVNDVRSFTNPELSVLGALITLFDSRTRLGREVIEEIRSTLDVEILEPFIPKSVKVAEAPGRGVSILDHARHSKVSEAYRELAAKLESQR